MNILKSKIFWSVILFISVFIVYFLPIDDIWFSIDDCGNIISGIIRSFKDFFRIFFEDERNYLYPINFNVPQANIISGFYRPMQHIPFSIIYYLFGFNAKAYFFVNVFFHGLNTILFFYLVSFFVPLYLSVFSGFLFAFYPVMNWITWISTLHNFMATFFMLISIILFRFFLIKDKKYLNNLAALAFLFSIFSRENMVVLGCWLFFAMFVFNNSKKISERIRFAFIKTWPFLFVYLIYFCIRLFAFGLQSLPRTFYNISLRLPFLKDFLL